MNNKSVMNNKLVIKCKDLVIDQPDNKTYIYIVGKTTKKENAVVRIDGFTPFSYMELPAYKKWTSRDAKLIFEYFRGKLGSNAPIHYELQRKFNLYGKKPGTYIMLKFLCNWHARSLEKKCLYAHNIRGVYNFNKGDLKVHEQNINPLIKFSALRNIKPSGEVQITTYTPPEEDENISTAKINRFARWNKIEPIILKNSKAIPLRILSYDIECYSVNHNSKIPDPKIPENFIFQIGITVHEDNEDTDKILISLFDCPPIDGARVLNCKNEKELIKVFVDVVNEIDPDIIIGYNILKFDWNYIIERAEYLGVFLYLTTLSCINSIKASARELTWSSSAYKTQKFRYLEIPGRPNIDILPEIERNYRFDTYSLNYVSQILLGEQKDDVSAKQIFRIIQFCLEMKEYRSKKILTKEDIVLIKDYFKKEVHEEELFDYDGKKTVIKIIYDAVINAKTSKDMKYALALGIWFIGKYCVQDTKLPIRLMVKLHILDNLEQMANTASIPISFLQTHGQQIKILSQVYHRTLRQNMVIPFKGYHQETIKKYQGAKVFKAVPGDYNNVSCLDFASLYPSIIQAYNIGWDTLVRDDSVPDEMCNIIEFDEHYLCEHDPDVISGKKKCAVGKTKRTKQKDGSYIDEEIITLCGRSKYRYLKVVEEDGAIKNEGVLPSLLRDFLTERKKVKKIMAFNEIGVKMNRGVETDEDVEYYEKMGWKRIEKDSLSEEQIKDMTLEAIRANSQQLALKVVANTGYGCLGAKTGFVPLLEGAASVTAKGRQLIEQSAKYTEEHYPLSRLVYGDTDSIMVCFNEGSLEKDFYMARKVSAEITNILPSVLVLEFENMYGRMVLLSKKRYITYRVNEKGEIIGTTKKGVVLARRDNCVYLREVYSNAVNSVLQNKSKDEVMYSIYDDCYKLFTRSIPEKKLVIVKSVQDPKEYHEDSTVSHVMLARKMIARGDDVPPNTRLEYLFLNINDPEKEKLQGNKIEDYYYYRDNKLKLGLKYDPVYYLEKQLAKPLSELIRVKYPNKTIVYIDPETFIFGTINKLPITIQKDISCRKTRREKVSCLREVCKDKMVTVKDNKKYEEVLTLCDMWLDSVPEHREEIYCRIFGNISSLSSVDINTIQRLKGDEKLRYLINDTVEEPPKELLYQCRRLFCMNMIKRIRTYYGIKAKRWHKPYQSKTTTITIDENLMKDMVIAHKSYKQVVGHLKSLFSPFEFVE